MNILFKDIIITVIFAAILGAISSIPVGAVQLEVIKKSINGHFKPAAATALGSATSDFIYGFLTLFGFGTFLMRKNFQIIIYILGIFVISYLLFRTFKERKYMIDKNENIVYKKRLSFLTGFTIAATNPGMIIWWIIGFKVFSDFAAFPEMTNTIKAVFLFSGCAGLGGYLILIASLLHRFNKSFSEKFLYRTNIILTILLGILILYFIFKLCNILFNLHIGI